MVSTVRTGDGRRLAVCQRGDPGGAPVMLFHGTPGSRLGPVPRAMTLHASGIRLLTFDRPGFGESDRQVGRSVASVATDAAAVADALGIERFAVLGRSGGGPHALACAALLPDRVTRAAAMVALAPRDAMGTAWFAGMTSGNVESYTRALTDPAALRRDLDERAASIRADPASLLANIDAGLEPTDRAVIRQANIRQELIASYAAAVAHSADGWYDDSLALAAPWGFDPADIEVPVYLWHGADDRFSPVSHTRWLGERIPRATVDLEPRASHFSALLRMPQVIAWSGARVSWDAAVALGG
ncbi:alpha/beta hydrolase [Catenulispora sp. NF23]|uniref:Alpha/beta hydrolase n=1 Tax=Catenulispora pinistramenti TaxID=2705254 RepID=A0ABS5KK07_9ACTN|nr:alpha/beta hydrolase [Catenulispora pinistramenti]MBS2538604.1 alpha/beta hydrolase [Catenulispora pinistramenti]MBS2545771.1 alpha/beta hydrolase [Catenulispora pinistramenti]